MAEQYDLLLITGIPGTGKTTYGNKFAVEFGFLHRDLEDQETLNHLVADPPKFIRGLLRENRNVVVTWGFAPDDQASPYLVQLFREAGFQWIWFDGNRPAALREFQRRGTVSERDLYVQMHRIENSRVVERLKPIVINSFDEHGQFKPANELLEEIRNVEGASNSYRTKQ